MRASCGVDLDGAKADTDLLATCAMQPGPSFMVTTSPGRFHVYWTLEPASDLSLAESIMRRLQRRFNGDRNACDRARVLRLAGTLHLKRDTPHLVTFAPLAAHGRPTTLAALDAALADVDDPLHETGARHPLGTAHLAAPSLDHVRHGLALVDPNDLDRGEWIPMMAAARQAAWTRGTPAEVDALLTDWCARYEADDPAESAKQIASLRSTSLGWHSLVRRVPTLQAALTFGGEAPTVPAGASVEPVALVKQDAAQFWSTFHADDAAKTSTVVCLKALTDGDVPVALDTFADRLMVTRRVPWDDPATRYPRPWTDNDATGFKALLEMSFIRPSTETVIGAIKLFAEGNRYHPVQDYLNILSWDGVERLPTFAATYFGTDANAYTEQVGTKYMISAVARIMQPGCKVDTLIILEGSQGKRKSSALKALAGADWFTDQLPDLTSKDASIQLRGKWIIEMGELVGMNRSEVNAVKSYAARSTDTYRPPYGRTTIDVPRQCVFAGSTNEDEYLRDQTGNRRFWPITCGSVDVAAIERDRDQLWAEATARFERGEQWWLDDEGDALARDEQDARREVDPWEGRIATQLANMTDFPITMEYVCCSILGLSFEKLDTRTNKRVAACLRAIGFEKRRVTGTDGRRSRVYSKRR